MSIKNSFLLTTILVLALLQALTDKGSSDQGYLEGYDGNPPNQYIKMVTIEPVPCYQYGCIRSNTWPCCYNIFLTNQVNIGDKVALDVYSNEGKFVDHKYAFFVENRDRSIIINISLKESKCGPFLGMGYSTLTVTHNNKEEPVLKFPGPVVYANFDLDKTKSVGRKIFESNEFKRYIVHVLASRCYEIGIGTPDGKVGHTQSYDTPNKPRDLIWDANNLTEIGGRMMTSDTRLGPYIVKENECK